jgi:hypothetical protein
MRARGINPWTAVPLLVLALLFCFLGVLQLTRALPKQTVVARGSVFGSNHDPGGRYSGESWNVYIDVPGHGVRTADSHGLYKAVRAAGRDVRVIVHIRGSLTTQVDYAGHAYHTTAVSRNEAWIEAVIFLALAGVAVGALAVALWLRYPRYPAATGA